MGKWTVEYHDDVFNSKMKTLVAGACKRLRLENNEPTISYEAFADDLDPGDAFTTTVIDILVKELADRRARDSTVDRHLIGDRTAKSLRALASPLCVHRPVGRVRHSVLQDYLTVPPAEMDLEEDPDDDFGAILDGAASSTAALYDAYGAHAPYRPPRLLSSTDESESPTDLGSFGHPTDYWSSYIPMGRNSAILNRQPPLRRTTRTRAGDFSSYSSRRRSEARDSNADHLHTAEPADAIPATDGRPSPYPRPPSHQPSSQPHSRRYFPLNRARRAFDPHSADGIPALPRPRSGGAEASSSNSTTPTSAAPRSNPFRQSLPPIHTIWPPQSDAASPLRSLRRGGVQAPESLSSLVAYHDMTSEEAHALFNLDRHDHHHNHDIEGAEPPHTVEPLVQEPAAAISNI